MSPSGKAQVVILEDIKSTLSLHYVGDNKTTSVKSISVSSMQLSNVTIHPKHSTHTSIITSVLLPPTANISNTSSYAALETTSEVHVVKASTVTPVVNHIL